MDVIIRRVAAGVLFLNCFAASAGAEEFVGTWLTEQGDAHVRVERCRAQMCGTVVWLRDPLDPKTGKPQVDDKNPNASLRNRPIIGLRIFAMDQDATGAWTGGIYNSDDGKNYRGRLSPRGDTEIEVHGCDGSMCGSEVWRRVADRPVPPQNRK
jgi:uncharacterized protein (DUF2147 family)